ncbi:hypothetical protein FSP39_002465 [Pinctada imbricata]|uniref:Integrase p58-like C-terminal domain-containing protein n=1 Tax=Pinctada imbricata TaxID=66713 RepID=A0AA89BJ19_PINIB|nr:hypothetical protein FSP39_002465 [Pinctada imbricata]
MVERGNRTILSMIAAFVSEHQKDWDEYLPILMMAYRSSVHSSSGVTPCNMMFGREINIPIDLALGRPNASENVSQSQYVQKLEEKLLGVHEFARGDLQMSSDVMKRNYDVNASLHDYNPGDMVWLFSPNRKVGLCPKLQRHWDGPYRVIEKMSDLVYRIQKLGKTRTQVVHHNHLKKYVGAAPSGDS